MQRVRECPDCKGLSIFIGVDPDCFYKYQCSFCYNIWRTEEKDEELWDYDGVLDKYLKRNYTDGC